MNKTLKICLISGLLVFLTCFLGSRLNKPKNELYIDWDSYHNELDKCSEATNKYLNEISLTCNPTIENDCEMKELKWKIITYERIECEDYIDLNDYMIEGESE